VLTKLTLIYYWRNNMALKDIKNTLIKGAMFLSSTAVKLAKDFGKEIKNGLIAGATLVATFGIYYLGIPFFKNTFGKLYEGFSNLLSLSWNKGVEVLRWGIDLTSRAISGFVQVIKNIPQNIVDLVKFTAGTAAILSTIPPVGYLSGLVASAVPAIVQTGMPQNNFKTFCYNTLRNAASLFGFAVGNVIAYQALTGEEVKEFEDIYSEKKLGIPTILSTGIVGSYAARKGFDFVASSMGFDKSWVERVTQAKQPTLTTEASNDLSIGS
jgi:hypothetical protein